MQGLSWSSRQGPWAIAYTLCWKGPPLLSLCESSSRLIGWRLPCAPVHLNDSGHERGLDMNLPEARSGGWRFPDNTHQWGLFTTKAPTEVLGTRGETEKRRRGTRFQIWLELSKCKKVYSVWNHKARKRWEKNNTHTKKSSCISLWCFWKLAQRQSPNRCAIKHGNKQRKTNLYITFLILPWIFQYR